MGGEEEIVRIAKRLDKMVAKKSAVSGGPPPTYTQPCSGERAASPRAALFWGGGVPVGKDPPASLLPFWGWGPSLLPISRPCFEGGLRVSPTAIVAVLQPCPPPPPQACLYQGLPRPPRPLAVPLGPPCSTNCLFWRGGLCVLIVKPLYPTLPPPAQHPGAPCFLTGQRSQPFFPVLLMEEGGDDPFASPLHSPGHICWHILS